MTPAFIPIAAWNGEDGATLVIFLLVVLGWVFRKLKPPKTDRERHEPRQPREGEPSPRADFPRQPPAPASSRPAPAPRATARRAPIDGSTGEKAPLFGDTPKKTTGPLAALSDFAATRATQTTPKGEKPGASAPSPAGPRPAPAAGRALLKLGDVPRRDRVRAALAWSIVLGPPRVRDRGLRARPRRGL